MTDHPNLLDAVMLAKARAKNQRDIELTAEAAATIRRALDDIEAAIAVLATVGQ